MSVYRYISGPSSHRIATQPWLSLRFQALGGRGARHRHARRERQGRGDAGRAACAARPAFPNRAERERPATDPDRRFGSLEPGNSNRRAFPFSLVSRLRPPNAIALVDKNVTRGAGIEHVLFDVAGLMHCVDDVVLGHAENRSDRTDDELCSRGHLQRIGIGPASGALCGTSLRSNVKHCGVTEAGLRSPVFRLAGTTAVSSWVDDPRRGRGTRSVGRERKLGLGISRVELALISNTGRQSGAAGSSVWGDEGGWAAAEDLSWSRAPFGDGIGFRTGVGFGAARRARLCCPRSGSLGPWLRRLRGGRSSETRRVRVAGAVARVEQRCAVTARGVGHRSDADCDGSTLRGKVIAVPDGREPPAMVV